MVLDDISEPLPDSFYEQGNLDDKVQALVNRWRKEVNAYRYGGDPGVLEEVKRDIREELKRCAKESLEEKVLEAALGDYQSISGRWEGSARKIEEGVERVRSLARLLKSDPVYGYRVIAQVRGWCGNALTRRAYLTRSAADQNEAAGEMERAYEKLIEHGGANEADKRLLATILRDFGDACVGQLVWDENVYIKGVSVRKLREAVRLFGILAEENPEKSGELEMEEQAARSSLVVACMFTVEHRSARKKDKAKICPYFEEEEPVECLTVEAVENIQRVWDYYKKIAGDVVPTRLGRVLSNVGFAAHFIWREWEGAGEDKAARRRMERLSWEAFKEGGELYSLDYQPFRLAVVQEGLGNLYRDRMVRSEDPKRRKRLGAAALLCYEASARSFSSCDSKEGLERAVECRARCVWVLERHARPDLTDLPDLWFDYALWHYGKPKNRQESQIGGKLGDQFAAAIAAAEEAADRAAQELERKIAEAQEHVPAGTKNRKALVADVERGVALGMTVKVKGRAATALILDRGCLAWRMAQGGTLGFGKHEVTVERSAGSEMAPGMSPEKSLNNT